MVVEIAEQLFALRPQKSEFPVNNQKWIPLPTPRYYLKITEKTLIFK